MTNSTDTIVGVIPLVVAGKIVSDISRRNRRRKMNNKMRKLG